MKVFMIMLLGITLLSCGKKRTIHITATNAATGMRYAGLEYRVYSSKTGMDGNEHYKTEASGTLNENGEAKVTVRDKSYRSYSVRVAEPPNSCYNKQITMFFDSPFDQNGHFNFEFAECAYMNLSINNINCQGGDLMNFRSRQSYTEWQGWAGDRVGCYSYLSPYSFQVPAGWRIYEWKVNRDGVITTHTDSIYLNAGVENGTFVMNY
ncbi:hypothetical protein [Fluviicola sp.]|uniref:hypothetical protein n=1 Tax=Fluviicola sp. TaxID=1917219 RepID=UPI00281D9CDB|nr:hypothetical protein [Fluviicola sp.]MDR0802086.1 hypothetical protein [Fluviicola sp.]